MTIFFFFKQKTAYEMRISDWSSDVCSSDLPERDDRQIFLGAMELGDEKEPPAYGDDPDRDLAGYVERVGAFQWRIVIPDPGKESRLDVFDMVPTTPLARLAHSARGRIPGAGHSFGAFKAS